MDFEALKTFVTVVDQKSFTKSSVMLNLSQPTVSFHIKNLEGFFNTTLIERSPKRFQVTPSGERVYQRARQILGLVDKTKAEILAFQNQTGGEIRIGASYTVGEYILPKVIKAFDNRYPGIDVKVTIANTEKINRGVQHHDHDVGMVEGQIDLQGLLATPFLEDEMVVIVPEDHPFRRKKQLNYQDLQDQVWVTREEGSGTRAILDALLNSYTIRPKKRIIIGSNHGVVQTVKEGLGVSILSRTVVKHTGAEKLIMKLPYIKPVTRYFSIVLPVNEEEVTSAVPLFLQEVDEQFAFTKRHL